MLRPHGLRARPGSTNGTLVSSGRHQRHIGVVAVLAGGSPERGRWGVRDGLGGWGWRLAVGGSGDERENRRRGRGRGRREGLAGAVWLSAGARAAWLSAGARAG